MVAEEQLEGRVHMIGPVPHEKARDLLVRQFSTIIGSARICGKAVEVLCAVVGSWSIVACCLGSCDAKHVLLQLLCLTHTRPVECKFSNLRCLFK